MIIHNDILALVAQLQSAAPAGFAIALQIRYTTPDFLFQTYPEEWRNLYSQRGLVMRDPTVLWGFENSGTIRWEDLRPLDTEGVLDLAARHGLRHGFTVALEGTEPELRTIGSFTREDRDFTDQEVAQIVNIARNLESLTASTADLDEATRDGLRQMSVIFTRS